MKTNQRHQVQSLRGPTSTRLDLEKQNQRGQTIVEAVVVFAIAIMVIVALVATTSLALARVQFARHQAQARAFTQEAMEWIRAERDKDWAVFRDRLGPPWGTPKTYCFNVLISPWPAEGSCTSYDLAGLFMRQATLVTRVNTNPGVPAECGGAGNSRCIEVKVTVSWQESGQTHKSEQSTYLTNWK